MAEERKEGKEAEKRRWGKRGWTNATPQILNRPSYIPLEISRFLRLNVLNETEMRHIWTPGQEIGNKSKQFC